ncbi:family 43 glycosylhydrolase [Paenibacillus validus]|uniref:family 43 glycosylhydrolase n=1 Tax=Paenibacillus validus TaxID=44253 RepID=UPI003D278B90
MRKKGSVTYSHIRKALAYVLISSMMLALMPPIPLAAAVGEPLAVFREDFNDGNADGWKAYGSADAANRGRWQVNEARQYTVNGSPGAKVIAEHTSFADLIYEADFQVGGIHSDQSGLIFRVTNVSDNVADGYNGYFAALRVDKKVMLGRVTGNNEWRELTTAPIDSANAHLKVIAVGNRIQVFVNDMNTPKIDFTDNDGKQITSAGAVGLRTWWGTSVIDNIQAKAYAAQTTAEPEFLTTGGTYASEQLVALTAGTSEATIRYTVDGSAPNPTSPVYSSPISIATTTLIQAYAEKAGETVSDVVSAHYVIAGQEPVFTENFDDGNSSGWTTYAGQQTGSWTVSQDVYAYQVTNPRGDKAVVDAVYADFQLEVDLNPQGTLQDSGVIFRVSDPGHGADKMNGYYAGLNTSGFLIVGKMNSAGNGGQGSWTGISQTVADVKPNEFNRLKVVALGTRYYIYLNGKLVTAFTDETYPSGTIGLRAWNDNKSAVYDNVSLLSLTKVTSQAKAPVFIPGGGTFKGSQTVMILSPTPGATIHYTTDGSMPNTSSPVYGSPLTVTQTTVLRAYAVKEGMLDSSTQTSVFTKEEHSFTEDFNDKQADGWTTYGGVWNAADGAYRVNKGAGFKSVAEGTDFADFTYEADITLQDGVNNDNAGLIFRVSDPSNGADSMKGYYAGLGVNGRVQLGRLSNSWTELASIMYPVQQNKTYRLKVTALGSQIDIYVDGEHIVSAVDSAYTTGAIGVRSHWVNAGYDNIRVQDAGAVVQPTYDWSWVKGAVFVPTHAVNQLQQWDAYNHEVNDRELSYAHTYGINFVRVFLHNLLWKNDSAKLLANLEDFLQLADKYGIKVEIVFFDDCWDDHPVPGPQLPPRYGAHNSRWVEAPGDDIKANYAANKDDLKSYVQGIVNAHKNDPRIAFWNIYNEPSNGESGLMDQITKQIMNDSRIWIKETGSSLPVSSTGAQFSGGPTSDFITWHPYESDYPTPFGVSKQILADETMNRLTQSVPGAVRHYGDQGIGFVMWEFGIGRDNTRFPWGSDVTPLTSEPEVPFHGIVYPDGHPWDVNDIKALTGPAFDTLPVFQVKYFKDASFTTLAKSSITPRVDFDLGDEKGTGSPDPTAGIGEDQFSIRWVGSIKPVQSGVHTVYVDSDHLAGVWIGDTKVVDKTSGGKEEISGDIALNAGQTYTVRIEYAHAAGDASMHVRWSGPGLAKQVMRPVYTGKSVQSVMLDTPSFSLKAGETKKLNAVVEPIDASNQQLLWSSSNTGAAAVDSTGLVRGVNKGTATITVTAADGGATATSEVTVSAGTTFVNPIVPVSGGAGAADPSIVFKDGFYYYVKSDSDSSLQVAKARRLQDIGTAPRVTVYTPPAGEPYSKELWAPELQYVKGKWYIYFAADDGNNANHRMYVLEGNSQDPQGTYTLKGKIADASDKWAIDGTVLEKDDGSMYFIWSGWEGDVNEKQNIYIAPMSDPWTISGSRVQLSTPDQPWERIGTPYINEGPEILKKDGKLFIVYSASGSWTDEYKLGLLTNLDGDVLNPASWTKSGPVFSQAPGAFGPGHNTFTTSPDGTEEWIVYHADLRSGGSWGNRSVRAQKFTWNADGTPNFGTPAAYGSPVEQPSGTPEVERYHYEAEYGELLGTAEIRNSADASGGKVVGRLDNTGTDGVIFHVNVERAGTYSLIVMAANGTAGGAAAQHDVSVNGAASQVISYRNYGWERYNPTSIDISLNAGANTIKLTKRNHFAELDSIILEALESSGSAVPVESVMLDKTALTLAQGETAAIVAAVRPLAGTMKQLTLTSSNPEVALVTESVVDSATGSTTLFIKGLKPGTAAVKVASAGNPALFTEAVVTVRGLPSEPDLTGFQVDSFDNAALSGEWSIFQESPGDWSLTQNPGALTIHTTPTDVYQDNNSQNNVFLRHPGSGDFEIVTKVTAPIAKNHQQGGLFIWQDADHFVKLAHVWVNGATIETAYEIGRSYKKPGNPAAHPGGDTITLKIRKLGNVYTTYYWNGYEWLQAADPVTATLTDIKVGLFANNIVATNDRIDAKFDYFAIRAIQGGVKLDPKKVTLRPGGNVQLTNLGASGKELHWSSSNPSIAAVTSSGWVEAKAPGRTVIKAASVNGDFWDQAVVTVEDTALPSGVLFTDDFTDNAADGWSTYGGVWTAAEGRLSVKAGAGHKALFDGQSFTDFMLEADVHIAGGNEAGLLFRATSAEIGADAYEGYYLGISAANQSVVLGSNSGGTWTELASRKLPVAADEWVHLKVIAREDHLQIYVNDNPLNVNGYPKFDLLEASHLATGRIGFRTWNADADFDNVRVTSIDESGLPAGPTYTNAVLPGVADPFILKHDGMYYLYGTNTADWPNMPNGIKVYSSPDLVNWTAHDGWALHKDHSWGDKQFWAPEVVEKDGIFYMYYAVQERLAVATSTSPLGPFVQEVQQPLHLNTPEIDAHIFTDDDGKCYMYFVRFNNGNEIWVAELNDDMKSIKEDTLRFVFRATQTWELSQKAPVANINEGPFVLKHNGLYYLTYSGNHFESPDYGVGYATAPTPTGPWTKYAYNPIMKSNAIVPGAGHHSFIGSPDGSELFMVYHTHYKAGTTEPRKLAIDRVHFVPQPGGIDALEVWGPTITPQPVPSHAKAQSVLAGAASTAGGMAFDLTFGLSAVTTVDFEHINALDVTVSFDPSQVELKDAAALREGIAIVEKRLLAPGKVRILAAALGAGLPANGDWLKLTFQALPVAEAVQTVVSVSGIAIANEAGAELMAKGASHSLQITAKAASKEALVQAIATAQAKHDGAWEDNRHGAYVPGSKATLQAAIDHAAATAVNAEATPQQITEALRTVSEALAAFESKRIDANLNGSGGITVGDLALTAASYGKQSGQPGWDEQAMKADVNYSGKVDIEDLVIVARAMLD